MALRADDKVVSCGRFQKKWWSPMWAWPVKLERAFLQPHPVCPSPPSPTLLEHSLCRDCPHSASVCSPVTILQCLDSSELSLSEEQNGALYQAAARLGTAPLLVAGGAVRVSAGRMSVPRKGNGEYLDCHQSPLGSL